MQFPVAKYSKDTSKFSLFNAHSRPARAGYTPTLYSYALKSSVWPAEDCTDEATSVVSSSVYS